MRADSRALLQSFDALLYARQFGFDFAQLGAESSLTLFPLFFLLSLRVCHLFCELPGLSSGRPVVAFLGWHTGRTLVVTLYQMRC